MKRGVRLDPGQRLAWEHTDASGDEIALIAFPQADDDGEAASLHSEVGGVYLTCDAIRGLRDALTGLLGETATQEVTLP